MAWVDLKGREPSAEGEYRVLRIGKAGEYEGVCAYEQPWSESKRHRKGIWYSTDSGSRVYNVRAWWEGDRDG